MSVNESEPTHTLTHWSVSWSLWVRSSLAIARDASINQFRISRVYILCSRPFSNLTCLAPSQLHRLTWSQTPFFHCSRLEVLDKNIGFFGQAFDKSSTADYVKTIALFLVNPLFHLLAALFCLQINADGFLVSCHGSKPWTLAITVKITPNTKRITDIWWLNFNL